MVEAYRVNLSHLHIQNLCYHVSGWKRLGWAMMTLEAWCSIQPKYEMTMFNDQLLKMASYCPQGSGTLRQQLLMMHGIACYCMVLQGIALYCIEVHGIAWYCNILHGIAWYCIVLHGIA